MKRSTDEIGDLLVTLAELLPAFDLAAKGETGAALRRACGDLTSDVVLKIQDNELGSKMLAAFDAAYDAGATLASMEILRDTLMDTEMATDAGEQVRLAALIFCMVEESKIVADMTFRSRTDAESMLLRMRDIFDDVKLEIANDVSADDYRNVVAMGASVMQHLAATERKLPQIVNYTMRANLPSLTLSQLIYHDASRSDELVAENAVVHPAFFPLELIALSK